MLKALAAETDVNLYITGKLHRGQEGWLVLVWSMCCFLVGSLCDYRLSIHIHPHTDIYQTQLTADNSKA